MTAATMAAHSPALSVAMMISETPGESLRPIDRYPRISSVEVARIFRYSCS
jgi:hypothetical protein